MDLVFQSPSVSTYVYSHSSTSLAQISAGISAERLGKYLLFSNNDLEKALELHSWNGHLGASLFTSLQQFEIVLRNACHRELQLIFNCPDWFNALPKTEPYRYLQEEIDKSQSRLSLNGRNPNNPPCVVADQNFGFWVALFVSNLHRDLYMGAKTKGALYKVAHLQPASTKKRETLHRVLKKLNGLRNRIAHHEPLFHRNLEQAHELIHETMSFICTDTADWSKHHSSFDRVRSNQPVLEAAAHQSLLKNQQNDHFYSINWQ